MKFPRSIFWKLALLILVTLSLSTLGQGLLVVRPAGKVLAQFYLEGLVREAAQAARALEPLMPPEEHQEEIRQLFETTFRAAPNLALVLFDERGHVWASLRPPRHHARRPGRLARLARRLSGTPVLRVGKNHHHPPLAAQRIGQAGSRYFVLATAERPGHALVHERYPRLGFRTILLIFLATAAASIWGLRLFSTRLTRLREGMEALARGELSTRLEPGGEDEVGELIRSFNQTAGSLEAAEQELARQDQARREMLADVSHELRTPLTTIRGHLELLLEDQETLDPGQARSVAIVFDEARCLSERIEDLLTLARQESGQLPLECVPCELGQWLSDLTGRFRDLCQDRGIELVVERPEEPRVASVDPDRLGQVLRNLLENALHNLSGGDTLTARLRPVEDGYVFEVEDDGPGIPEEDLPHLFERFRRGQGSRGAGTGLGLAIARGLVEQHGGRCSVTSRLGEGSCFQVWLPRGPEDETRALPESTEPAGGPDPEPDPAE